MKKKIGALKPIRNKDGDFVYPARIVNGIAIPEIPAGGGIYAQWGIQVLDPDGTVVVEKRGPSHSFTRQYGFWNRGFLNNVDSALNVNETLTDDTGASFLCRLKSVNTSTSAIVSGLAKMKFGNSSTAVSTTQTNLQGTLLGPTTEATVTVSLTVEDSTNTIFTCQGQITNGTGGAFSVEEMGLFAELNSQPNVANNTTMMLRDLTGTTAVNNTQTIIGTYTFTIAV